jgi:hypothetical protein
MSEPQSILATHKIEISYTSLGVAHKKQIYCNAVADGTATTGYRLVGRTGLSDPDFGVAVVAYVLKAAILIGPSDGFTSATLLHYTGGVYVPLATVALTQVGTGGSGGAHANQVTLFGRSADYDQWKDIFLDTDNSVLDHGAIGTGGSGTFTYTDDVANQTAGHAGYWLRSRSGTFFGNWVSYTVSFNRKLRRNRGLV